MGVWGAGLYSGDFAADLRTTIRAVARLPYDGNKLVEILRSTELQAANDPNDSDHVIFWLVVADQFAKRGIDSDLARDTALEIIRSGADLSMLEKLGADPAMLKKRGKMLEELRARITAPVASNSRGPVLKKPQAFIMDVGEVLLYPVFGGRCINPYCSSRKQDRHGTQAPIWTQDGWSAVVMVDRGKAFDFLTWYRPLTISKAETEKPSLPDLRTERLWALRHAGTCSPLHFKRLEFEKIGALHIDGEKLRCAFPGMRPGTSQAVNDISIGNSISIPPYAPADLFPMPGGPPYVRHGRPYPTILGINQLLSD